MSFPEPNAEFIRLIAELTNAMSKYGRCGHCALTSCPWQVKQVRSAEAFAPDVLYSAVTFCHVA